ncbi:unnamed protein product [Ixodes pacificus]
MMASAASRATRRNYQEKFDARAYADMINHLTKSQVSFHQEELHRLFQSDLVQGKTLLDVGSGPSICRLFALSRRFNDIVLSDLVEGCILELNKWINKAEDAVDWTARAEEIAELEGYSDIKKGALEIQERTRSSIRKVVPCDVLEPGVLPEEHRETFDVVVSGGTLESAAVDDESYRIVVKNVGALVKPGGLLVLSGFGGLKNTYRLGTADFPLPNFTEDVIKQALKDAGFQVKVDRTKRSAAEFGTPEAFTFVFAAHKP